MSYGTEWRSPQTGQMKPTPRRRFRLAPSSRGRQKVVAFSLPKQCNRFSFSVFHSCIVAADPVSPKMGERLPRLFVRNETIPAIPVETIAVQTC